MYIDPNTGVQYDDNGQPAGATGPAGTPSPTGIPSPTGATVNPNKVAQSAPAMDPALRAIYDKYGMTPGGRGSGFADWQYWQDKGSSQYDRLSADIAGTGTDNPEGTPGTGPWQNSGKQAPSPTTTAIPGGITGDQLLQQGQAYYQQQYGTALTPDVIAQITQALGGTTDPNYRYTPADLAKIKSWIDTHPPGPQVGTHSQPTPTNTPGATTGPGTTGTGTPGGTGSATGGGSTADDLFSFLMSRAKQGEVVDPNDPVIKNQTTAYRDEQTRDARQMLSDTAETLGPNANMTAQRQHAGEVVGRNTSGFQATLMQNELTARRQEIESALSGAQGLLTSEQQMQLQDELQRLSLAQQNTQFYSAQAQQDKLAQQQFGLSYAQLNEQQQEFVKNLAQRAYEFDANLQYLQSPLKG